MQQNKRVKKRNSRQLSLLCAKTAIDKKATNIAILDMRKKLGIADYFLIFSGQSDRQVQGLADGIRERLKEEGLLPRGVEGYQDARWIVMDYNDIVIHIFYDYLRDFYDLEGLWSNVPRVPIPRSYLLPPISRKRIQEKAALHA